MKTLYFTDDKVKMISTVYYTSRHEWDTQTNEWVSHITPWVKYCFPSCAVLYPGIIKYIVYTSIDGEADEQFYIEVGGIPTGVLQWELRESTYEGAEPVNIPLRCYLQLNNWQIKGSHRV